MENLIRMGTKKELRLEAKKATISSIKSVKEENGTQKEVRKQELSLEEISREECWQKRKSAKPGRLLKVEDHLYYTDATKGNFSGLGKHLCFDCQNGTVAECSKVRDLFPTGEKNHPNRWKESSCRLERYRMITLGYETFNVEKEVLVVCKCNNFVQAEEETKKRKPTKK